MMYNERVPLIFFYDFISFLFSRFSSVDEGIYMVEGEGERERDMAVLLSSRTER